MVNALQPKQHRSTELQNACNDIGLQQKVTKPTKDNHLLDLVLTKVPGVRTRILPSISEHQLVITKIQFKVPERVIIPRTAWVYAKADWDRMHSLLEENELDCMETMDPNTAS